MNTGNIRFYFYYHGRPIDVVISREDLAEMARIRELNPEKYEGEDGHLQLIAEAKAAVRARSKQGKDNSTIKK